jgi:amino acid adenylation domain-containing protein
MSDLSRTLAALDPKKRELLALLARREGIDLSRTPIVPLPRDGSPRPLSFAQERLWFLDQLVPGGTAYNLPGAVRLRAAIDPAVLAWTFAEIARRHDALRTTFITDGERPVQVAAPPGPVPVPVIDLSGLPAAVADPELRRIAREEAGTPFDLARGPVLRVRLVRLGPADHALLTTMHHIASDGWSTGLLVDEVVTIYAAFSEGLPSPLPELPIQYADFAAWQRQALQGAALDEQLAWWRRSLEGASMVLDLPADRPRPAVQGHRGVRAVGKLPSGAVDALAELTASEGATLFMTLLSAMATYLQRISGQNDLCLGTPVAGRKRVETERLIGFFVNTLAVRADLAGDPPFREALRRVRTAAVGAFEHQDTPFERIVEEVHAERDLSRTPVFQVVLSLQNVPRASDTAPFPIEPLPGGEPSALYDLTLTATDTGAGLSFALDGNADLFEPATMRRMAGHLETLLAGIAENPERRLSELPLLTESEVRQVLEEWSGPAQAEDAEADLPLPERIARRAAEAPDAPAVEQDGRTLTYGELQERASSLAAHLREMGVGPESLVAVLMDRSPELVATLVGVMAAGAAYLPIDPGTPEERVDAILADAGVELTLTPGPSPTHPPDPPGEGSSDSRVLSIQDLLLPPRPVDREGVWERGIEGVRVYVIYTSGSTGTPKGVEITHAGLSSLIAWHLKEFQVDRSCRATQLAGLGFDASVWEIWPYLAAGASIRLIGSEVSLDPEALADELIARGITHSFVPTPLAEGLVAALARRIEAGSSPALRFLLTGGDRLHRGPERALPFRLFNAYGPTESSVVTTAGPVAAGAVHPSIGRPIAGRTVRLLDRHLNPVPAGVPGELYVGGPGLARGYRGRPDLTAERFLPDPFSELEGDRLYATGDLARWSVEGEIEFLGRADGQVKIRGVRVEPGEIEAALGRHPGVREAAVLPWAAAPGDLRLAAYVVPEGSPLSPAELRGFLRERLPDAMVPSAWALLDRMPITPNGKVDRRALEQIELVAETPEKAAYVEPRTPAEAAIARLFAELLGAERVGAEDDFFALGGHSLLASRLAARVRERFGVPLALRHFFETPTPAGLARVIEATEAMETAASTLEDEERETFRL